MYFCSGWGEIFVTEFNNHMFNRLVISMGNKDSLFLLLLSHWQAKYFLRCAKFTTFIIPRRRRTTVFILPWGSGRWAFSAVCSSVWGWVRAVSSYCCLSSALRRRRSCEGEQQLQAQYNVLSRRLDEAMGVLQDIQQRDDNLYRVIFMADPIPSAIRQAGYGGTNRYEHLMDMANSDLVINTTAENGYD